MARLPQAGVALDGQRIVHLRRQQAFTQIALADRSGLYKLTVRNAEQSKPVSLRTWRAISEALGVEPDELLPAGVEA